VIVDEAAMTSDETIYALAPMLAVSRGRFVLLSTPLGQRGFFFEAWQDTAADWERIRFTAEENMRIDRAWLAEQRRIMGPRWYNQEFMCSFEETTGQVFSSESILAAFDSDRPALFGGRLG
jgi:hypothetical protein